MERKVPQAQEIMTDEDMMGTMIDYDLNPFSPAKYPVPYKREKIPPRRSPPKQSPPKMKVRVNETLLIVCSFPYLLQAFQLQAMSSLLPSSVGC